MSHRLGLAIATALVLSGCTALTRQVLVEDKQPLPPNSTTISHCSGSEWQDPVAFFVMGVAAHRRLLV